MQLSRHSYRGIFWSFCILFITHFKRVPIAHFYFSVFSNYIVWILMLIIHSNIIINIACCLDFSTQSTPKTLKGLSKKEGTKRKINMSGYILFSSEMRAVIKARHPDFSFGELSRLVGTEWRNLESTRKSEYEGRFTWKPWKPNLSLLAYVAITFFCFFCLLFLQTNVSLIN